MEWLEFCKSFIPKIKAQYKSRVGKELNLENPKTLTEKIQWLKVYDSSFLKTYCADKILLHDYCESKLGKDICIPIISTYDKPEQIEWNKLPNKFVIKCNHGSGYNIIVEDKTKLDKAEVNSKLNKWLNENYALFGGELHYYNIKRKILIEEYKESIDNDLVDYKFWCFNGEPKYFSIGAGHGHGALNYYDFNMKLYPYQRLDYHCDRNIKWDKPSRFEEMLDIAKILSKDFKFVRVDFYEINKEVFLGELTFTPGDGYFKFEGNGDLSVGKMLDL